MKTANTTLTTLKTPTDPGLAIPNLLLLLFTLLFFASCETDDTLPIQTNSPVFNLDKFEQNIIDYVNVSEPYDWR